MKKYITLVFEYSTDEELTKIREYAMDDNCRAWSLEHELLRLDLIENAVRDGDMETAIKYIDSINVSEHIGDLG